MNRSRWVLPFLFAALFWSSFPPLDLGFLAWISLVPLLVYAKTTAGPKAFFVAWLGGWLAFMSCFFWVRYTVPVAPYLLGIYEGFYIALFVWLVRRLGCLWSPAVWVALEYVRGYLFGGLPWFILGYSQHEALLPIQIADLGGVWLVSALVALVNAAIGDGRKTVRWAAGLALVASVLYGAVRLATLPQADGPTVAVVQPNIPQDIKQEAHRDPGQAVRNYEKHLALTLEVAREAKPDLIVWPEASIYRGIVWKRKEQEWEAWRVWYKRIVAPARDSQTPLLIGLLVIEPGEEGEPDQYTNSGVVVDPDRGIVRRYDKVHLVPFAEFTPLATTFPVIRRLLEKYSGLYLADMRPGEGFPVWELKGERYGTQICFEAVFPEISREIARKGASFTVNISNDGWFRASGELDQMLAMARFRAIENRIHVIRATNTGISAFIEPSGRVQALLEVGGKTKEVEGTLSARIRITRSGSLYRLLGNWVGWGAVGAVLLGVAGFIFVDRGRKSA
jgi:apolipoprotein N-acyltransferase